MSDCNTRDWRKAERLSKKARRYRRSNAAGFSRAEGTHHRRLGARSYELSSGKSLTSMSGLLAFVTRCLDGKTQTRVDAPRFGGGSKSARSSARGARSEARRPSRRSKRVSRKAFARRRYENAGDYIRFKSAREKTFGPVRPELQPRWLGVKSKKGYRKAGVESRRSNELEALRRQLKKAGVPSSSIKHHIWKLTFYGNPDGATSEVDLKGGIAYIMTRKKGGKLVTRIEKE